MKRVLVVAYHYPPVQVSSGVQRTLAFTRALCDSGWMPTVLSAHPRAYPETSQDQLQDIPRDIKVVRAFALDSARHLALRGRYLPGLDLPDRWVSWWLGGVLAGLKQIRQQRPQVIFATYPIATAFLIAATLSRLTGIPWVADFRDSMVDDSYPVGRLRRRLYRVIERWAVRSCCKAIFTTRSTCELYRTRYPDLPADRWAVIPNGYSEAIFAEVERNLTPRQVTGAAPITLLHSGIVYPRERDPSALFQALAELKTEGLLDASQLRVVFRASGHDSVYHPQVRALGIEDLVHFESTLDYRAALAELLSVDALLVLQGGSCNHQVPAKLYEYFRARKPILALSDPGGDTATALEAAGLKAIYPLDQVAPIKAGMMAFLASLKRADAAVADPATVTATARETTAKALPALLSACIN